MSRLLLKASRRTHCSLMMLLHLLPLFAAITICGISEQKRDKLDVRWTTFDIGTRVKCDRKVQILGRTWSRRGRPVDTISIAGNPPGFVEQVLSRRRGWVDWQRRPCRRRHLRSPLEYALSRASAEEEKLGVRKQKKKQQEQQVLEVAGAFVYLFI